MENSQLELGVYVGLFKYSDAMIHNCSSFIIEYHFTRNPVMFLQVDKNQTERQLNEFGSAALKAHYIGTYEEEIEEFIKNVIRGADKMQELRNKFYQTYLLPPNKKSASQNIIDVLLG